MRDLFRLLWSVPPVVPGCVTFWFLPSTLSRHIPFAELATLEDADLAELHAINQGRTGVFTEPQHVYFGLGARTPGLGAETQGDRSHVVALPGFALDIDLLTEDNAHAAKDLPATIEQAYEIFQHAPDPSAVIHTGNGLHLYWAFKQPVLIGPDGTWDATERAYEAFWAGFKTRARDRGWRLDKTCTVQRVWRVPGFLNQKDPDRPKPVVKLHLDAGARFDLDMLVAVRPAAGPVVAVPALSPGNTATDSAPALSSVSGPPGPPSDFPLPPAAAPVVESLKRLRSERSRTLMARALAGESLAPAGDRDRALQRACSILGWIAPEVPTDVLVEILRPSLTCWACEPGADLTPAEEIAKAADKINRAKRDWSRKNRAAIDALRAVLGIVSPPVSEDDTPPDDDEIAGVLRHLLIQYRNAFYVFDFGSMEYTTPRIKDELGPTMRDAWADSLVEFYYQNAQNVWKEKKLPDLFKQYSTVARSMISDLTLQQGRYDADTKTFYEATTPLLKREPRRDLDIETWLDLLGGPFVSQLLDWIASVTYLNHQCCAIYLSGKKGAGKGLLSAGLARLWHHGGPTEFGQIMGNFNADIATCPLICLDEGLPKTVSGVSKFLRSLVGSSGRTLSRKYMPNAPLRGSIRLMITANNDNVLQFGDESMSLLDLEATVGRFLHLPIRPEAVAYLEQLKARDQEILDRWVDGGLLAQHALWLRNNRQVAPGSRFLVEGSETQMHRALMTQGNTNGLVFEWLARFLDNPGALYKIYQTQGKPALVMVGEGKILVNTLGLLSCWSTYMGADIRAPSLNRVGEILRLVSIGEVRRPAQVGPRYHLIRPELVVEWAIENQVGDEDQMAARLTGAFPPIRHLTSVPT